MSDMLTELQPGQCWWHFCLHTRGTWLPGDPRGFRSRGHRIHSSGDYKSPPPLGENARLYAYHQARSKSTIHLSAEAQAAVGDRLLKKIENRFPLLAVAVGVTHAHIQMGYEDDYQLAKRFIGTLKQSTSRAVGRIMPGRIWADGGKPIRVRNRQHQRQLYQYIIDHHAERAWVWTYRDGVLKPDLHP